MQGCAFRDTYKLRLVAIQLRPGSTAGLSLHTKVYVLADRFNLPKLKDLAFNNITTLYAKSGRAPLESDVDAVMGSVTYAFRNLPFSVSAQKVHCSPNYLDSKEKLLVYMARYIAWARDAFQTNVAFLDLLAECPEFAVALVVSSRATLAAPWSEPGTENLISYESTTHILSRLCTNCFFQGVMYICCTFCRRYDFEVGLQVGMTAVQGTERLSGKKECFIYTCKWCRRQNKCSTDTETFNHPCTGQICFGKSNMNPLVCRKCNTFGCMGQMSMI